VRVRDWKELNKKSVQPRSSSKKFATFVILCLAILVASFCILCTLLLMVTEKSKEIAIPKSLERSDGSILAIFMGEGMLIGAIGTSLRRRDRLCKPFKGLDRFFGLRLRMAEGVLTSIGCPISAGPHRFRAGGVIGGSSSPR